MSADELNEDDLADAYWQQERVNERDEWDLLERDIEEREQERLDDHGN